MHLKRFSADGRKVGTSVSFPLENLSLAEFSVQHTDIRSDCVYDLYAVSNHKGHSADGGHYTAHAKTSSDMWCMFDDADVTPIESANLNLNGSHAYILFYRRRRPQAVNELTPTGLDKTSDEKSPRFVHLFSY